MLAPIFGLCSPSRLLYLTSGRRTKEGERPWRVRPPATRSEKRMLLPSFIPEKLSPGSSSTEASRTGSVGSDSRR